MRCKYGYFITKSLGSNNNNNDDDSGFMSFIIENYNIQNAIFSRFDQRKSTNFKLFEKTKVENIYFDGDKNDKSNDQHSPFNLLDWPNVKLNDGKILKTKLLVNIIPEIL